MKCKVLSCEYNNVNCLKANEAELLEGGDGLYCSCYKEKKSIKLSRFKIVEITVDSRQELVVVSLNYRGVANLLEEVLDEINNIYGLIPANLIFDCTCSRGTKNHYRYYTAQIKNNRAVNILAVEDELLLRQLKEITCRELAKNPNCLDSSILTSAQKKMILKGIVI